MINIYAKLIPLGTFIALFIGGCPQDTPNDDSASDSARRQHGMSMVQQRVSSAKFNQHVGVDGGPMIDWAAYDSGGAVNEVGFQFSTMWEGAWKGTPENGTVDLAYGDQNIEFVISCTFNGTTISGDGQWTGTCPAAACESLTLSQHNSWNFLHVPRGD